MTTGEKIKMLRVKKGMSQEELGFEFCCLHQTAAQQRHIRKPRKSLKIRTSGVFSTHF